MIPSVMTQSQMVAYDVPPIGRYYAHSAAGTAGPARFAGLEMPVQFGTLGGTSVYASRWTSCSEIAEAIYQISPASKRRWAGRTLPASPP